jgi:hypothetical protein
MRLSDSDSVQGGRWFDPDATQVAFPLGGIGTGNISIAWIIHENIYRNGLAADGGFRRPQSPLGVPKSVLEPIQWPKRMNTQLNVAD